MRKELVYGALILSLVGAALWLLRRHHDQKVDQQIAAPALGSDDKAKIIIDQKRHVLTRVERDSTTNRETVVRSYLNPHGPVSIVEKKDGKTVLVQRTWGTQLSPNIGGAFGSDFKFRVAAGLNLFYVQRWEVGGGLLLQPGDLRDVRAYGALSYNVYGDWLISGAYDNHRTVQLIASVRF